MVCASCRLILVVVAVFMLQGFVVESQTVPCLCNTSETWAGLAGLHDATGGRTSWLRVDKWLSPSSTVCEWYGVRCVGIAGLLAVNLSSNGLQGTLPSQLGRVANMFSFDIRHNSVSGELPQAWSSWTRLSSFYAFGNLLQGQLPSSYSSWSQLSTFHVAFNQLSGSLPSTYKNWTLLRFFNVYRNQLTGRIPSEFSAWTTIDTFMVYSNRLSGNLPPQYGLTWQNIETFRVDDNSLTGSLPVEYKAWTSLRYFYTERNRLTGSLPVEYSAWEILQTFAVAYNRLNGTLPTAYARWSRVRMFRVNDNNLTGTLPREFSAWSALIDFRIEENEITGTLPGAYRNWTFLETFDVSHNKLNGSLPGEFGVWTFLSKFEISTNGFSGSLPKAYETFASSAASELRFGFYVSSNQLSGSLPREYGAWGARVARVSVFENRLTGTLPPEYGLWTSIESFLFGLNNITGVLPASYQSFANIKNFTAIGNNISGTLPAEYAVWRSVEFFRVSKNHLTGTIPHEYAAWTAIGQFLIGANRISGNLPPSFGEAWGASLTVLNVGGNALTGTIPPGYFRDLQRLVTFNAVSNRLSGTLPAMSQPLVNLTTLGLDDNVLEGTVPLSWATSFPSLELLGLSRNPFLSGTIPQRFSRLLMVALCDSPFCGSIPSLWLSPLTMFTCYPLEYIDDTLSSSEMFVQFLKIMVPVPKRLPECSLTNQSLPPPGMTLEPPDAAHPVAPADTLLAVAVAAAAVTSPLSSLLSAGFGAQRLSLLLRMRHRSCGDDLLASDVGTVESLWQLKVGSSVGAAHRGAVVGNVAMALAVVGFFAAIGCAVGLCKDAQRRGIRGYLRRAVRGCFTIRFPGVACCVLPLLLQQTVLSSTVLVSASSGIASDVLLGVFGLLISGAGVAAAARFLCKANALAFAVCVNRAQLNWAVCRRRFRGQVLRAVAVFALSPSCVWSTTSPLFLLSVEHLGLLFEAHRECRRWWLVVELSATVVLGVLGGVDARSEAVCSALLWLALCASCALLVAVLALQPAASRFDAALLLWLSAGQAVVAGCVVFRAPDDVTVGLSLVFGSTATLSSVLCVISVAVDALCWPHRKLGLVPEHDDADGRYAVLKASRRQPQLCGVSPCSRQALERLVQSICDKNRDCASVLLNTPSIRREHHQ